MSGRSRRDHPPVEGSARYLVTIHRLEETDGVPVPTGRIAETLDRSPSATTEMIQRPDATGLIDYDPYDGVGLTDAGRDRARELRESYRTLCRFYREVLGLEDYEGQALAVTGIIDPAVVARLETRLLPAGRACGQTTPNASPNGFDSGPDRGPDG